MSAPVLRASAQLVGLVITIPGKPVAHGRPDFTTAPKWGHHRPSRGYAVTPPSTRAWLASARAEYIKALNLGMWPRPLISEGPVELFVTAVYAPTKADAKTGLATVRRPRALDTGDADNLAKSSMDAGNGILWKDDCQVGRLVVERWTGAAGEEPHVQVLVRPWSVESGACLTLGGGNALRGGETR